MKQKKKSLFILITASYTSIKFVIQKIYYMKKKKQITSRIRQQNNNNNNNNK